VSVRSVHVFQHHAPPSLGHIGVVRRLIDANINVNECDTFGWTALMLAAEMGHVEVVKELVGADAALDVRDVHGANALKLAYRGAHVEIVRVLASRADLRGYSVPMPLYDSSFNEDDQRWPGQKDRDMMECKRIIQEVTVIRRPGVDMT
jgi:ankyrin repeat protein